MGNKLKEMFSDDIYAINGQLKFEDNAALKEFVKALKIVEEEGRAVPVEGVKSISTKISSNSANYPVSEHKNISNVTLYPAVDTVEYKIQVENEERKILFYRSERKNEIVLETGKQEVVYFQMIYTKESKGLKINYKVQFNHANTIEEVLYSFSSAVALVSTLFVPDAPNSDEEDKRVFQALFEYFKNSEAFFRRLRMVESELDLTIVPHRLDNMSLEEAQCVDEIYLLLCKKKVIRLNAKITPHEASVVMHPDRPKDLEVGDRIGITFFEQMEYSFLGEKISLHTANLISDAIIKEIKKEEKEDSITVIYGDTDSRPMYISFTAFKTFEEAKYEREHIMKDREKEYVNALKTYEYMMNLAKELNA